ALKAWLRLGKAVAAHDGIGRHEADVVAVAGVAVTGVAQPDEQLHRRALLLALFRLSGFLLGWWRGFLRGSGRGLFRRLVGDRGRRSDGGYGEVAVGDDRAHVLRQRHVADVDAVADVEALEVDLDPFRDGIDRAVQLHLVAHHVQDAAALQAPAFLV